MVWRWRPKAVFFHHRDEDRVGLGVEKGKPRAPASVFDFALWRYVARTGRSTGPYFSDFGVYQEL